MDIKDLLKKEKKEYILEAPSTLTVLPSGTRRWLSKGQLHRLDGPAVIGTNGTKQWYFEGQLHREGGPAVTYYTSHELSLGGSKWWYKHGKLHREDGAAVEYPDGTKYWYLNNVEVTAEDVFELLTEEDKMNAIFNMDYWSGNGVRGW
jgi:hypothetical protein